MIEQQAIITQTQGASARLSLARSAPCTICGQQKGCGNATWGKLLGAGEHQFSADNPIGAQVGQYVVVGLQESGMLRATFLLYVLPLFAMLLSAGIADAFFSNQFYVFCACALGLALSIVAVKQYVARQEANNETAQYRAVILRLAQAGEVIVGCDKK